MISLLAHAPWLDKAIKVAVIFVAATVVVRAGRKVIGRLEGVRADAEPSRVARRATLVRLTSSVLRYVVDFLAIVMALDVVGISTTSLLAGAGILGLAIGFGAQGLVQDVVTGLFILYEDQYAVGDHISLPGLTLSGTVLELGIRITRLSGSNGDETIIPNRLVLEVQNLTRGTPSVSVVVPVVSGFDPEVARRTLEELVSELEHQVKGLQLKGVSDIQSGAVSWELSAPATAITASQVGYQIREGIARAIYENHIPLAGGVQEIQWTNQNTN